MLTALLAKLNKAKCMWLLLTRTSNISLGEQKYTYKRTKLTIVFKVSIVKFTAVATALFPFNVNCGFFRKNGNQSIHARRNTRLRMRHRCARSYKILVVTANRHMAYVRGQKSEDGPAVHGWRVLQLRTKARGVLLRKVKNSNAKIPLKAESSASWSWLKYISPAKTRRWRRRCTHEAR